MPFPLLPRSLLVAQQRRGGCGGGGRRRRREEEEEEEERRGAGRGEFEHKDWYLLQAGSERREQVRSTRHSEQ
eukprot:748922-Hanusia_phi.AAC.1